MAIQLILSQSGPLPISATCEAPGDEPMYLEVNGSVWAQETDAIIGIGVELDGNNIGFAQIYSNGSSTHRPVVPAYVQVQLAEGQHTLTLFAYTGETISDMNDFYTAVIHY